MYPVSKFKNGSAERVQVSSANCKSIHSRMHTCTAGIAGFEGAGGTELASLVAMCLQHAADRRPSLTTIKRTLATLIEESSTTQDAYACTPFSSSIDVRDGYAASPLRRAAAIKEARTAIKDWEYALAQTEEEEKEETAFVARDVCVNVVGCDTAAPARDILVWAATRRLVRTLCAHEQLPQAEEECVRALGHLVDSGAALVWVGKAQLELACVLLKMCRSGVCA
jgi:hypothetical protein